VSEVHTLTKHDIITAYNQAHGSSRCRESRLIHILLAPVVIGEKNQCHGKSLMETILQRLVRKKLDIIDDAFHVAMVDFDFRWI
jgi:hypothetical protein